MDGQTQAALLLFAMGVVSFAAAGYAYARPERFMKPDYPERVRRWIPIIYGAQPAMAGVAFLVAGVLFLLGIL